MKAGKDYVGVGCGGIIINEEENKVLLVKRSLNSRTEPGYWSRPGGEVEYGETIEEAVKREILEETGIITKVTKFLELTQIIDKEKGNHWIALGYLAKYISGEPKNLEPEKHNEVKWFSLSKLPTKLTSYTKNALKVYNNSK